MEGLRGVAAVTVLVGHVQIHLAKSVQLGAAGSVLGVALNGLTLFFALSGFLLFRPFATALLNGSTFPDVGRFFQNRGLRIFPAYLVIFAVTAFVLGAAYRTPAGPIGGVESTAGTVGRMSDPAVIVPNLFMVQTLFPWSIKTGLGVAWSLTVELTFYLLLPLIAYIGVKAVLPKAFGALTSVARALLPVAVVFGIGFVGKLIFALTYDPVSADQSFFLQWGGNWYAVFVRSFLVQGDLFSFGMLAAVAVAVVESGRLSTTGVARMRWIALGLAVFFVLSPSVVNYRSFYDTAYALAFGAVILFVALPNRTGSAGRVAGALEWAPLRFLGLISYSLYLWHLPVLWTLDKLGWAAPETRWGFGLNVVLVLVVAGSLSTLTYFFVEKPPLKLKKRTDVAARRRSARPSSASAVPKPAAS